MLHSLTRRSPPQAMPEDRISLCVPYAFEAWEAPALARELAAKLSAHYIQHEYRECPSKDPEVVAMLEALLPEAEVTRWVATARSERASWQREQVPMDRRRPLLLQALAGLYEDQA